MTSVIYRYQERLIWISLASFIFFNVSTARSDTAGIGEWKETTPLPQSLATPWWAGKPLVFHNNRVYVFGGRNAESSYLTNVYYSNINSDGSLGTWSENSLPSQYFDQDVVKIGNYVYLVTGASSIDVYYTSINQNGSLGEWIRTNSYGSAQGFALASDDQFIYLVAGNAGGMQNFVRFTSQEKDGSLSLWQDTTPLPEPTQDSQTAFIYKQHLYVLTHTGNIYLAPINTDGNLGSWKKTTSMPEVASAYNSFEYNGSLYLLGGNSNLAYYAPISEEGEVGEWKTTTHLPLSLTGMRVGTYNGFVYAIGGQYGSDFQNTAYYALITNEESKPNLPPRGTSTNLLEFSFLKEFYRVGEEIVLNLYEHVHSSNRFSRVDLWVAIEVPSGEFYFKTSSWSTPFSFLPQPFKRSLENLEVTDPILNFEVVPEMGGTYTFYALFVQEGTNPIRDGFSVQRSNLAIISTTLANY